MKSFLLNKDEIARINTIFAMIMVMVGVAYYYLINLTTELIWVLMCGFLFIAIPSLFTLFHGAVSKRGDIVLLSIEFLLLGVLGFAAKLLHGIGQLTLYSYLYAAAYAFSSFFVFSFADKIAFGKRLLSKWWFILIMLVVSIVPAVLLYVLPDNMVSLFILIKNIVNVVIFLAALAFGILGIVKSKNKAFSWAYASYAFLTAVAYVFQLFTAVRWYNLFLMLALIAVPYVLMYAVKSKE